MLSYEGIPLRRIQQIDPARFLIERADRATFLVPIQSIGSDHGVDEILSVATRYPGQVLETPGAR